MADQKRNRRQKAEPTEEQDQVLRIAIWVVVALFVVAIIFVGVRLINADPDVTEGREKLAAMADQNADSIDASIMARQSILTDDDEEEEAEESEDSEDSDVTEEVIHTEVNEDGEEETDEDEEPEDDEETETTENTEG